MAKTNKESKRNLLSIVYCLLSYSRGYTLVELLAVTSIIVIVAGLIIGVLYSTLRGSTKTKVTNDVAQNGNYAISVISNTAILADSVTKVNGVDISDCTTLQTGKSIEFKSSDGSTVEFSCDPVEESVASTSAGVTSYLIDNESVKVPQATCSFSCLQPNGSPYDQPIISAEFVIEQRASDALFENVASSKFDTSVTMRNFNPR